MSDYSKLNYYSGLNTFKNTGVFNTSLVFSGTLLSGAQTSYTKTFTLTEDQQFSFVQAQYTDKTKGGVAIWQMIPPDFSNLSIVTSPVVLVRRELPCRLLTKY
jgi:hypothetical protein